MPDKNPYQCECGGDAAPDGTKNLRHARKCRKCGKRWWLAHCWKCFEQVLDERFVAICRSCGWPICPSCRACGCQPNSPLGHWHEL